MTTISSDIVQGPSKFDLMLALFDRKPINTRSVEFKLAGGNNISAHVVLNGVEVESGCGESWIFKGYVRRASPSLERSVPAPPSDCWGYYRTDTRKGWIKLVD